MSSQLRLPYPPRRATSKALPRRHEQMEAQQIESAKIVLSSPAVYGLGLVLWARLVLDRASSSSLACFFS
jgi:hypothetical protein